MEYKTSEVQRGYSKRYREANREKVRASNKKYRESHSEALKDARYRREYGITRSDKERMYKEQGGLCGSCYLPLPENFDEAAIDHNHITGRVRSLLHSHCNTVEGIETKYPGTLSKILEYKKRWDAVEQIYPLQAEDNS